MTTSRQTLSAKQRNCNYRPNGAIASHVSQETRYINSTSPVIHSKDCYFVQSVKFADMKLYYTVTVDEQVQWSTSASDERVARTLIQKVEAYRKDRLATEVKTVVRQAEEIVKESAPIVEENNAIEYLLNAMKPSTSIRDGFYTVSLPGDDKHRTFRLRTQEADASFAPGKQVIGFLSGSNNESDYVNFGFVIGGEVCLWKKFQHAYNLGKYQQVVEAAQYLMGDGYAEEAGKMYAQESGNCYVCNRTLTTPESIENGIGPVCARKAA